MQNKLNISNDKEALDLFRVYEGLNRQELKELWNYMKLNRSEFYSSISDRTDIINFVKSSISYLEGKLNEN